MWQPTFAGDQVNIIVTVEYPSLVALAEARTKTTASAEWQKFLEKFNKAGMRLLSSLVSLEISP